MKALQIENVGSLDHLVVRDVSEAPLREGEVRVEIEAAAVNPSDVGVALGRFPQLTLPRVLGRDFAGRIVQGPPELIGEAVWGSGGGELGLTRDGAHAESMVLPARALVRRPAHFSAEEAAAVGVPFFTAWSALVDAAGIRAGEWAIISGAAGAVGTAAIQLLGALGAHAIALIKEDDDASRLAQYNVAAIARSGRDDLTEIVRGLTDGKGAEVALNAVGAPVFAPLFDALAKDGRMVVISAAGGREVTLDLFALYRKRVELLGLDTAIFDLDHVARTLEHLNPLFEARTLKAPAVGAVYPLSRAREAYDSVSRGAEGKVVLVPG
jgi:NADPH:quinone reductase-like Zn-dependent oxidoreductase